MYKFSIVVPVFNEEDSLEKLVDEISVVMGAMNETWEICFVDDGSTDNSWNVIRGLSESNSQVKGLRFRRNFGKAAALQAGVNQAAGELIITMDADLQDDPAEIPAMIESLGDQYDVVSGWKKIRRDPLGKTIPSKFFNWMVGWLTGVKLHDHNCGFKIYRREVFNDIRLYGEMHRFVPVLAAAQGYRVTECVVNHRKREFGHSKYGWSRLVKGFLDLLTVSFLTGFKQRPQHLLGSIGLTAFGLGAVGLTWMAIYWVLRMTMYPGWDPVHQRPVVLYSVGALLLGSQLLCMGFLAELLVAKGQERQQPFSIKEKTASAEPGLHSVSEQSKAV